MKNNPLYEIMVNNELCTLDHRLEIFGYKVLRLFRPETIYSCLELFEDELFEYPDVILIDNIKNRTIPILQNNKQIYNYCGVDNTGHLCSESLIFINRSAGLNTILLFGRYILIFKDLESKKRFLYYYR
jgi:hypothetical protein